CESPPASRPAAAPPSVRWRHLRYAVGRPLGRVRTPPGVPGYVLGTMTSGAQWRGGPAVPRREPGTARTVGHLPADRRQPGGVPVDPYGGEDRVRRGEPRRPVPGAGVLRPVRRDPGGAAGQPPAAAGGQRPGG